MRVAGIIAVVVAHLVAGVAIALYAFTVEWLPTAWCANTGILIGLALARRLRRWALMVPLLFALTMIGTVVCFVLPIHSLDVGEINEIRITDDEKGWSVVITERADIDQFLTYFRKGRYESIILGGRGYELDLTDRSESGYISHHYYILRGAIGGSPRGFSQTVFVPQQAGFGECVERMLERHGHPAER